MRPSLLTRLFELFALLVSAVLCVGFLIGGYVSKEGGTLTVGLVLIGPTYTAGRVMLRDWKRPETA